MCPVTVTARKPAAKRRWRRRHAAAAMPGLEYRCHFPWNPSAMDAIPRNPGRAPGSDPRREPVLDRSVQMSE